tara:strand:- start:191 stop:526 length:336 start_codon:yes stop_codon:yes gene_type:complete
MGLNYNRGGAIKYYSSDRICSLISNGLLTFLQTNYSYEDFFENKKEAIYYTTYDEVIEGIKKYSKDYKLRSEIAFNGKKRYFQLFENNLVTKYMMDKIFDKKIEKKLTWMN